MPSTVFETAGAGQGLVPASVDAYYNRTLLERALPLLVHDRWGQMRPLPQKMGTRVVRFRKYGALAVNITEITQGVTPAGTILSSSDITATVRQYGDFVQLTDWVDFFSADPVLTEATELLGEQAGQSIDITRRDILVAGTQVVFSGTATARAGVVSLIDLEDLDRAIRLLHNGNVRQVTPGIRPTDRVDTRAVRRGYWAVVHPDIVFTLDNLAGYIPVANYGDGGMSAVDGEVGAYKNVRFVQSTFAKVFAGAGAASATVKNTGGLADVYVTLVFGADAYGVIDLSGNAMQSIIKGYGAGDDPLNQRMTAGWKAQTTTRILQDGFFLRLETAAAL